RGAPAAFMEVRFRDAGVGIPAGDLKNLFIPFFTRRDRGTGRGLPISQRIIENHGGTIEVRSQPGEGAAFTVLLPIEADIYAAYPESIRLEPGRAESTPVLPRVPRADRARAGPRRATPPGPAPASPSPASSAADGAPTPARGHT